MKLHVFHLSKADLDKLIFPFYRPDLKRKPFILKENYLNSKCSQECVPSQTQGEITRSKRG